MAKTAGTTIPSLTSSALPRQPEDSPPNSDFEILCDDGRSIECSRQTLLANWPWFRTLRPGQRSDFPPHPTTLPDHRRGKLLHHDTLQLPEPFPIALALVQYFETLKLETHLQRQPLVLTGLLEVAKVYDLAHLDKLCVDALHARLNATTAGSIADIARELGCLELAASADRILATTRTNLETSNGAPGPASTPSNSNPSGLRRSGARPRSRSHGPDQRKSRPLSSVDDVARSPTITVWSPPDVPVPPFLLTIPSSPNISSFASPSPATSQRSRSGSNRSIGAPRSPSTQTPRPTSTSYDIPILPPPFDSSPPSTPVTPRMMPPRPAHADLSGGLFELALVDDKPATIPEFQVGDIVPAPPPPPPSATSRPPSRRSGSLPPLSWSASSATTSGDDESLKSPTSLASKLPWKKHNFPLPPSSSPSAAYPAIADSAADASGPTARKLQRRHPLLRRPHSIDTIISVMSNAGDAADDDDDHKNRIDEDDFGGSDRGHQHTRPSPRSPGSNFKEDSSTSTHDSGATHGARTSFVSLGGLSRPGGVPGGPALPNSKEAKKLDKKYKELMKAQEKFESARTLVHQKILLAEQKAKAREAEEKRKAQDKVLLKLIEEKRARVLAEDRRKRRWEGGGGGFGGGGVGVVGGFFG